MPLVNPTNSNSITIRTEFPPLNGWLISSKFYHNLGMPLVNPLKKLTTTHHIIKLRFGKRRITDALIWYIGIPTCHRG